MSKWTTEAMPDQTGRTVLITGANSGLGLRSAEALAQGGARVVLACRDKGRGQAALEAVKPLATSAEPVLVRLDLADQASVKDAAAEVVSIVDHLDVLMNNAGIMAIPLRRNPDGWEAQLATNHLGHYALTGRLLPVLRPAPAPRVVTTSSQAHRIGRMHWDDLQWEHGYQRWSAYGQSKLANLLFTLELDRQARAAGSPLVATAAHPGWSATHLQEAGPKMQGNKLMASTMRVANTVIAQSDTMGALPQLFAATAPGVEGGQYFGPGGPLEWRGHPKRVHPSGAAKDKAAAARLWEISEELTGVTIDLAAST
jgi:NAD(P)-dependent dehydrogenase (short-subunit alcohol dehydrogenase family)